MNRLTSDSAAWQFQAWASFALSSGAMVLGIAYLPVSGWMRGYLAMGQLFTVASCFVLAKTVRDQHEAKRLLSRIDEVKTEKLLRDYELGAPRPDH